LRCFDADRQVAFRKRVRPIVRIPTPQKPNAAASERPLEPVKGMRPLNVVDVEPCSCTVDDDVSGTVVVVEPSSWKVVDVDAFVVVVELAAIEDVVDEGAVLVEVSGTVLVVVVEEGAVVVEVAVDVDVDVLVEVAGTVLVVVFGTEVVDGGQVVVVELVLQ
jgi:hypothetical protein